jgi:hypothetical protein
MGNGRKKGREIKKTQRELIASDIISEKQTYLRHCIFPGSGSAPS